MDNESDLPQDYEQIPWSHLVPVQKDRSAQLTMAVVVIVAVALAVFFLIRRTPSVTPIVAATTEAPAVVTEPEPLPDVTADQTITTTAAPTQPKIYSEADLMAVLPLPEHDNRLEAIARAEWFVTDYFTVDGDAALTAGVNSVLPAAVELPTTDGAAISYVEWARAVDVIEHEDEALSVTVWFRTLIGDVDGGFSRTDVRAVEVSLVVDEGGRLAIADVPIAAAVAPAGSAPTWDDGASPPREVVAAGADALAAFGSEAELESAGVAGDGWRLLFSVGDASGLRFPIVVKLAP